MSAPSPSAANPPPRPRRGVVFVGAGPGDPALLTVRAVEYLRTADVVVHDALVPEAVLDLVGPHARRLPAPRDGRDAGSDPGATIGRLLADLTAGGGSVVRLKGGDPGVFGRLAEEIAPLRAAGVPVEIVPGVTAATAAAAAAGIPLTSRSAASSLTILTGHEAVDKPGGIDFASLAALPGTLVIYMGVEQVDRWSQALLAAGRTPRTPVTIVSHCSWPDQRIATSTLAACAADFERHNWSAPAVVIVGEVAQAPERPVAAAGPLAGRRVLITRPEGQGDDLHGRVVAAGGSCVHVPTIRIGPPPTWEPLDRALGCADTFDWIVFASANGVRSFVDRLRFHGRDGRALGTARLAAIGPATRRELERAGFACDLTPDLHRSEGIVAAFEDGHAAAARFLLVRANRGRDLMRRELEARGHSVSEVAAYSSEPVEELDEAARRAVDRAPVDWLVLTSSFNAESTLRRFGPRVAGWRIASLSPVTSATLRRLGVEPAVEAADAGMESLVAAIVAWERSRSGPG